MRQCAGINHGPLWFAKRIKSVPLIRLAKEGFWVVAGQVLAVTGALVGVRVLTGLLPPETYGELALGMTVATLLNQVVFGPLSNGALRFYAVAKEEGDLPAYVIAVKNMAIVATKWIIAITLPVATLILFTRYARWFGLAVAALVFGILSGYNGILDAIQNAARQRLVVAWHQGLASWGRFLLAAGLILLLGSSSTTAIAGFAATLMVVLASQSWFLLRSVNAPLTKAPVDRRTITRWRTHVLSYSWPFAAWGWITWAQQASDRWFLELFTTTGDVGQYAVLYQLGYYPIMLASGMVVQLIGPVLFQRAGTGQEFTRLQVSKRLNRTIVLYIGIMSIALWGILLLIHRPIFSLLVSESYRTLSGLFPWMVLAGGIFATGQVLCLEFMTSVNTRSLVIPKVVTAVLGIGLNLIGATTYGVSGVVAANVLWSILYFAILFVYLRYAEYHTSGKSG